MRRTDNIAWLVLGAAACQPPEPERSEPALRELVPAVDVDPDPRVVEITLVAVAAVVEYEPGVATSVLAYRDGASDGPALVPGPLVEANVGDRLRVHFRNELPDFDTTIHWHGLRLPETMDGNPMVAGTVAPGETFEVDFVLRDAGTFWYHPHVDSDVQIELGLMGPMVVHDVDPPTYAADRLLVLDDVALAGDGSVDLALSDDDAMMGRRDGTILVNGAAAPVSLVAAPGSVERWRVVNASNGRFFRLASDAAGLRVIGWDAGAIPAPYDVDALIVGPGERYELAVAMPSEPGEYDVRTLAIDRGHGGSAADPEAELLAITVEGEPATSSPSEPVRAIEPLDVAVATERRIVLTSDLDNSAGPAYFINDERWPLNTVLHVDAGSVDVWEIVNDEHHHHPFHIHGLFFQVLSRDGTPEPRIGWKDTTIVGPEETVRIAVPYDEVGMWMYHCQIPEHAERGMMGDLMVHPAP